MAIQIQARRDTAANWTSKNPTLAQGEFGYETDTGQMKIGDGSTAWTSLSYFGGGISDAPNDGTAYTRKSLGWSALVPSDLAQASATDGQVLTWNDSSGQWEPADSSGGGGAGLWNDGSGFIYRDGPVQLGKSTPTDGGSTNNVTHLVQSKFDSSGYQFQKYLSLAGDELHYYRNDGISYYSGMMGIGTPGLSNFMLYLKAAGDTSSFGALLIRNSSNNQIVNISGGATRFDTNPVGFHRAGLSNFTITVQSNNAGGGTIILYSNSGSLNAQFDNDANYRTTGGAYFGRQFKPNGSQQVVIRGKGTGTGRNLELEDSGGTKNAYFYDNGNIDFLRLPTSDPLVLGRLWNDSGTLKVSAG